MFSTRDTTTNPVVEAF